MLGTLDYLALMGLFGLVGYVYYEWTQRRRYRQPDISRTQDLNPVFRPSTFIVNFFGTNVPSVDQVESTLKEKFKKDVLIQVQKTEN